MYDPTSVKFVGPLKTLNENSCMIKDEQILWNSVRIGFIGYTYAGKTSIVKSLTNTLGGFYHEVTFDGRTQRDESYIFAEYVLKGNKEVLPIELKTHNGGWIDGTEGPKGEYSIVVIGEKKSQTPNYQLSRIQPIIDHEGIKYKDCPVLITRASSEEDLTKRRLNMIKKREFKSHHYVDNRPLKKHFNFANFDPTNVDVILEVLASTYEETKLIYFGEESIPESLEGKVTPFDNHFEFESWEEPAPEEDILTQIFGEG